jgi:molybdopterin/thiamine biosynthesis adenylyltransferase
LISFELNEKQVKTMDAPTNEVDLNLYSRQIYVLGLDVMQTLTQLNVLVSGLSGLGVEIG